MTRKKNSDAETSANFDESLPDLSDGEKVIITDQRTIEKKTVPAAMQTANVRDFSNQIEDFDDFDDEKPVYSENSIAALIESGGDNLENEFCTVLIRREPDNLGDNFLNPCKNRLALQPLRNVELTADRTEIEERVREVSGGGHYYFQVHYNGSLTASWKQSLADSPEAIAAAKAEKLAQSQPPPQNSTQTAITADVKNPLDQFFENLERQKKMKDLLFGEELKEIERLRLENEKLNNQIRLGQSDTPANEKLAILQYVEKMQNAEIQSKVLGFVFDEQETGGGMLDTAKYFIENSDKVLNFTQKVFGALFGGMPNAAAPTQADVANMMRGTISTTPPKTAMKDQSPEGDTVAIENRSSFRRAKQKGEKAK